MNGPDGRAPDSRAPDSRAQWLVPAGLVMLSAVPVLAGVLRLAELSGGDITPSNARCFAVPVPVVVHIVSAITYSIPGPFRFAPGFRRSRRTWHRAAGRLLVPCGLAALSGLWMAQL